MITPLREKSKSSDSIRRIIGGGFGNVEANPSFGVIGGGDSNLVQSNFSTLGGGQGNIIGTNSEHSVIVGGSGNYATAPRSTIGGGVGNLIFANDTITDKTLVFDTVPAGSVIAGGDTNTIHAPLSTIGGGSGNLIQIQRIGACYCSSPASVGTIAGGVNDTIGSIDARWIDTSIINSPFYASPIMTAIAGGYKNTVNGMYGAVGGGYKNHALGMGSAIPGGIGLEALDFQTAVGRYNKNPVYILQLNHNSGPRADTIASIGDMITFMVGNGTSADSAHRSNAFTVSDNGHATAYQSLPTTSGTTTITGTTYEDNTIIAWGDVSPAGILVAGIGCKVTHTGLGTYVITLQVNDPTTGLSHAFTTNDAAIVATPMRTSPGGATLIMADPLAGGPPAIFTVYIWDVAANKLNDNIGFQFHVVAH